MKIRTGVPNFGWKSGKTGLWRENMMLTEKYPILSYANNKQVIMRCCSYNWGLIDIY